MSCPACWEERDLRSLQTPADPGAAGLKVGLLVGRTVASKWAGQAALSKVVAPPGPHWKEENQNCLGPHTERTMDS